ncbi:zinc-binding alcohol dehydrogenase family protein [Streptomyces sp. NPDC090306]|uniref:quinone oxidoreductase family protein n=1 Tax=Streptomyces sp. NPDC090306 TaxID=3365961 RepID=UPI00380B988B
MQSTQPPDGARHPGAAGGHPDRPEPNAAAGAAGSGPTADEIAAAIVDAPGAEPRLGTVVPRPRTPGTTLVAVVAAPLNPLDLAIASGTFHSVRHEGPYVPGSECVGVVIESDRHPAGSWVYGECDAAPDNPGSFADRTLLPDENLLPLPEGIDPVAAAAVGNAGVAAYLPLLEQGRLGAGETVLVLGATGAVGQLAVQVARLHGAGRVVGVARDGAALTRLAGLGADAVVELRAEEGVDDLAARILAAAGPVDVVLDGVYGAPLEAALRVCAPRARVVNIGNPAGATAQVPAGLLRGKQLTLSGFAGLHTSMRDKRVALSWLWSALARGELRTTIRTVDLAELPAAWRAQAASPHHKWVVLPQGEHRLPHGRPQSASSALDARRPLSGTAADDARTGEARA